MPAEYLRSEQAAEAEKDLASETAPRNRRHIATMGGEPWRRRTTLQETMQETGGRGKTNWWFQARPRGHAE
jgi:hypothetical protein